MSKLTDSDDSGKLYKENDKYHKSHKFKKESQITNIKF